MKYRFYLSTTCASSDHLSDAVRELTGHGFHHIELSGHLTYQHNFEAKVLDLHHRGVHFLIHHYCPPSKSPFVLNIASASEEIRERSLEVLQKGHDLNRRLGGPFCAVHGGHNIDMEPKMKNNHFIVDQGTLRDRGKAEEQFYANLQEVMTTIFSDGERLAVENLATKSRTENYSLLSDPDQILKYLQFSRRYDNLGFLLDLGHLQVAAHNLEFDGLTLARRILREYPDKVYGLHLSDNDGTFDDHQVHSPDSWQWDFLEEFSAVLHGRPVVFEWGRKTNSPETFKAGIAMLKRRFGAQACIS